MGHVKMHQYCDSESIVMFIFIYLFFKQTDQKQPI